MTAMACPVCWRPGRLLSAHPHHTRAIFRLRLSPQARFLCGRESVTCGRHDLSLEPGLQLVHCDGFPGPAGLQQPQDLLVDDVAPEVTERDKGLLKGFFYV